MRFDGSVVLVTGASRGIGREVARQAVAKGAHVAVMARATADLEVLQKELGGSCIVTTADVTDREQVRAAVDAVERETGRVDVLVNNAGVGRYDSFRMTGVDDVERLMRVNYLGVVNVLDAVVPGMVSRRTGHLVTIGSISGRIGSPFEAPYSATKFAVIGLTEALSVELAPFGIGVSLVNPGPVETDFFAARGHAYDRSRPRPVSPERVARAVVRAVERERAEVFVPAALRQAVVFKALVPPLYRWGTRLAFRRELAAESGAADRQAASSTEP